MRSGHSIGFAALELERPLQKPVQVLALAAIACGLGAPPATAVSFLPVGTLPTDGYYYSYAGDLSADGRTVVGYTGNPAQAYRWRNGVMRGLGDLPGGSFYSIAAAASADGSTVVGRSHSASGYEAMRWTGAGGMVSLGAGGTQSIATGVSADGSMIVGWAYDGQYEGFLWTAGTGAVRLGHLPGPYEQTQASAITPDGSTVVGTSVNQAFRWTANDGMIGLGDLPGGSTDSGASGISSDGTTIIGRSNSSLGYEAFRWTADDGMVGLGLLPGTTQSTASDVSADGSIIVGTASDSGGSGRGFIWDETYGLRDLRQVFVTLGLDMTGWTIVSATGISDDGRRIAGTGISPAGDPMAWIASIPEPGSGALLAAGLLFAVAASRRSRAAPGS